MFIELKCRLELSLFKPFLRLVVLPLMSFTKIILGYLLTTVVFFAIDILWLGLIAQQMCGLFWWLECCS